MTGRVSLPKLLSDWKKGDGRQTLLLKKHALGEKKKRELHSSVIRHSLTTKYLIQITYVLRSYIALGCVVFIINKRISLFFLF